MSELIQSDGLAMIKQNALNDGKKYTIASMTRNFVEGVMKATADQNRPALRRAVGG